MEDLGRHTNGKRLFGVTLTAPLFLAPPVLGRDSHLRAPRPVYCVIVAVVSTPDHAVMDWAAYIGVAPEHLVETDGSVREIARSVASYGVKLRAEIARRLFPDIEERFGVEYRA